MKKIAIGQRWRTRGGEVVTITGNDGHRVYPWDLSNGLCVTGTGQRFCGGFDSFDIVELIVDEPASSAAPEGFTSWAGGEQPAETKGKRVSIAMRGGITNDDACADEFRWGHEGRPGDILAYKIIQSTAPTAPALLDRAAGHMRDRAATYDKPGGERSMAQTVAIFNLHHGTTLTEAQGWHFMQILKDVRLFTGATYHADSAEDCIAYAGLKAEALAKGGAA